MTEKKERLEFLKKELTRYGIFYSKGSLHRWGSSGNYFGCKDYHSTKNLDSCIAWAEGFLEGWVRNDKISLIGA